MFGVMHALLTLGARISPRPAIFRRRAFLVHGDEAKRPEPFPHVRSARSDGKRDRAVFELGRRDQILLRQPTPHL